MLKKIAFTLCEVLIVIGIIGIIAELTVPTLVKQFQNQMYATLIQKAWSDTSQFLKMYMVDQGISDLNDSDLGNNADAAIRKYFKVIKVCMPGDTSCQITEKTLTSNTSANFFPIPSAVVQHYTFITVDGIEYEFMYYTGYSGASSCKPMSYPTGKISSFCGELIIDVNGPKAPNIFGRDLWFYFFIAQDGTLYPAGGRDWAYGFNGNYSYYWRNYPAYCGTPGSKDLTNGGTGVAGYCLSRIMENSWVIDY